jgi:hypothetical protein
MPFYGLLPRLQYRPLTNPQYALAKCASWNKSTMPHGPVQSQRLGRGCPTKLLPFQVSTWMHVETRKLQHSVGYSSSNILHIIYRAWNLKWNTAYRWAMILFWIRLVTWTQLTCLIQYIVSHYRCNMKTEDGRFAPSTHTRPQGPSWRGLAETFLMSGVTFMITLYIKDAIFKSDSFFVQWGIYASLYTMFNVLYQKVQSIWTYLSEKRLYI